MTISYAFRVDSDLDIGIGHIKRCLAIAKELKKTGVTSVFIVRETLAKIQLLVSKEDIQCFLLPKDINYNNEFEEISKLDLPDEVHIVMDLSQQYTLSDLDSFNLYVNKLKGKYKFVSLIDGFMNTCVSALINLPIDILIIPYVGAKKLLLKTNATRLLAGVDYFVFDPEDVPNLGQDRVITDVANKILITAGGSDPEEITLKAFDAVNLISTVELELKIVIGPAFSEKQIKELVERTKNSRLKTELITAPSSLSKLMLWSDLAISASGLTKYLLAATGTPSILVSIDESHAKINDSFNNLNSSFHMGVANNVSINALMNQVEELINSKSKRTVMSMAGMTSIDGNSNNRLTEEFNNYLIK